MAIGAYGMNAFPALGPQFGRPVFPGGGVLVLAPLDPFYQIAHCVLALIAATFGAGLSRFCFSGATETRETVAADPDRPGIGSALRDQDPSPGAGPVRATRTGVAASARRGRWRHPVVILALGLAITGAIGGAAILTGSPRWEIAATGSTCWFLGLAIIGLARARQAQRTAWLAAVIFGWGAMILSFQTNITNGFWPYVQPAADSPLFATSEDFEGLSENRDPAFPWTTASLDPPSAEDAPILRALAVRGPIHLQKDTPLEEALELVRARTQSSQLPHGIPIHVDPISLQMAEQKLSSPVRINLDDVPLKTSLRLMLMPLGLDYIVRGRLLLVVTRRQAIELAVARRHAAVLAISNDPVQHVRRCLIALLAATIGTTVAPRVFRYAPDSDRASAEYS
jgi:hypothetical protein